MLCLLVGTIVLNLSGAVAGAADLSLKRIVNLNSVRGRRAGRSAGRPTRER
jgi:hypothetical protein